MTREYQVEKMLDELEEEFAKANMPVNDKLTLFAKVSNIIYRYAEQDLCENKYIKVPKKALKYRTAGMVAYNAEWLKNNFDIERAVICGEQEPCTDAISRQAVLDLMQMKMGGKELYMAVYELPHVKPTEKQEPCENPHIYECSCGYGWDKSKVVRHHFCPNCGRKVQEAKE